MNNPKVSIIMSVYNETKKQLKESINSILMQSYKNFEFIIINDNPSNEKQLMFLNDFSRRDPRIHLILNDKNIGITHSLNKGLSFVKGDYIARMDADDISMPERLEKQVKFLDVNKSIDLVGTNGCFIDENGHYLWKGEDLPTNPDVIAKTLKYVNYFKHPSWMFRKKILSSIKSYRNIFFAEDYDFLSRMISNKMQLSNINEILIKYRVRTTSISNKNSLSQLKAAEYVNKLYNQRVKNTVDTYNEPNVYDYLRSTEKEKSHNAKANIFFIKATYYKKHKKYIRAGIYLLANSLLCRYSRKRNINILKYKIYTCFNK